MYSYIFFVLMSSPCIYLHMHGCINLSTHRWRQELLYIVTNRQQATEHASQPQPVSQSTRQYSLPAKKDRLFSLKETTTMLSEMAGTKTSSVAKKVNSIKASLLAKHGTVQYIYLHSYSEYSGVHVLCTV